MQHSAIVERLLFCIKAEVSFTAKRKRFGSIKVKFSVKTTFWFLCLHVCACLCVRVGGGGGCAPASSHKNLDRHLCPLLLMFVSSWCALGITNWIDHKHMSFGHCSICSLLFSPILPALNKTEVVMMQLGWVDGEIENKKKNSIDTQLTADRTSNSIPSFFFFLPNCGNLIFEWGHKVWAIRCGAQPLLSLMADWPPWVNSPLEPTREARGTAAWAKANYIWAIIRRLSAPTRRDKEKLLSVSGWQLWNSATSWFGFFFPSPGNVI